MGEESQRGTAKKLREAIILAPENSATKGHPCQKRKNEIRPSVVSFKARANQETVCPVNEVESSGKGVVGTVRKEIILSASGPFEEVLRLA